MNNLPPAVIPPFTTIPTPLPVGTRDRLAGLIPCGGKATLYDLFVLDGGLATDVMSHYTRNIAPIVERIFGLRVCVWHQISTARHNTAENTDFHNWHTDAWFFDLLSDDGMTVWLPFDDVGTKAPSLEFELDNQIITPVLKAGQSLAFGMHARHRTQRCCHVNVPEVAGSMIRA